VTRTESILASPFGLNGFGVSAVTAGCSDRDAKLTVGDAGPAQRVSSVEHCMTCTVCVPSASALPV
jgi:hypothetical protein